MGTGRGAERKIIESEQMIYYAAAAAAPLHHVEYVSQLVSGCLLHTLFLRKMCVFVCWFVRRIKWMNSSTMVLVIRPVITPVNMSGTAILRNIDSNFCSERDMTPPRWQMKRQLYQFRMWVVCADNNSEKTKLYLPNALTAVGEVIWIHPNTDIIPKWKINAEAQSYVCLTPPLEVFSSIRFEQMR